MEFIKAIQNGDPTVLLSNIYKIHNEHEKHFQDIIRDLQFKFDELNELEDFKIEIPKNTKESKRKRIVTEDEKLLPNDSICTTNLKDPLGSSTPTETCSTMSNKDNCEEFNDKFEKIALQTTPVNESRHPIQTESVRKRIEQFEKLASTPTVMSTSKIPIPTPAKKNLLTSTIPKNLTINLEKVKEDNKKPRILIEKSKDASIKSQIQVDGTKGVKTAKTRLTRNNSNILQDKSTNIKLSKDKSSDLLIKKPVTRKASVDETKKKNEDTYSKIVANKEVSEKEKRIAALKQKREKEKEEKIRAVQKQKEEKLLVLKKKQMETSTNLATNDKKTETKLEVKTTKVKCVKVNSLESYNIDDVLDGASTDEEDNPTKQIPSWATKENRKHQLCAQAWLNKKKTVYLLFYNKCLKYPRVEELFSVDVKIRPRTSSAVWNNSSVNSFRDSFHY